MKDFLGALASIIHLHFMHKTPRRGSPAVFYVANLVKHRIFWNNCNII